jgi:hypothetical protein
MPPARTYHQFCGEPDMSAERAGATASVMRSGPRFVQAISAVRPLHHLAAEGRG